VCTGRSVLYMCQMGRAGGTTASQIAVKFPFVWNYDPVWWLARRPCNVATAHVATLPSQAVNSLKALARQPDIRKLHYQYNPEMHSSTKWAVRVHAPLPGQC
jgi:hypothetical protein